MCRGCSVLVCCGPLLKCPISMFLCVQDTQKQILEYAKEACQAIGPDFKDQCLNYVELYGPLVVNMVVQYLKPQLCIDAGYCPQPTFNQMMHSS